MQTQQISKENNKWWKLKINGPNKKSQKINSISSVQRSATQILPTSQESQKINNATNPALKKLPFDSQENTFKEKIEIKHNYSNILDGDQFSEIFSYLNLNSLRIACQVSKGWNQKLSNDFNLLRKLVYQEKALGPEIWLRAFGKGTVTKQDCQEAYLSLTPKVIEKLKSPCKAFPGKYVYQSHTLVWRLKELKGQPITERNLAELVNNCFFKRTDKGYNYILPPLLNNTMESITESGWVFITNEVLPKSKNKSTFEHQSMIANLSKEAKLQYRLPKRIEIVFGIFSKHFSLGNREIYYGTKPKTYIRCIEYVDTVNISTTSDAEPDTGIVLIFEP